MENYRMVEFIEECMNGDKTIYLTDAPAEVTEKMVALYADDMQEEIDDIFKQYDFIVIASTETMLREIFSKIEKRVICDNKYYL